ncbi:hypothetical protein [Microcoleus sp. B4-C1]
MLAYAIACLYLPQSRAIAPMIASGHPFNSPPSCPPLRSGGARAI